MTKQLNPDAAWRELEAAAATPDAGAQPGPEEFVDDGVQPEEAAAVDLDRVQWPASDSAAPDYAYVDGKSAPSQFALSADALEAVIAANHFEPHWERDLIAIALRGAQLVSEHEVENAAEIDLHDVRPDHRSFQCVLGFYDRSSRKITLYTGSTVPCRRAVFSYRHGGSPSNMLPCGCHSMVVWRHKSLRPALRMGKSSANPEPGAAATVLRNKNNYQYEQLDLFDYSFPLDNVHCSYYLDENAYLGSCFSSWGCLTVRGRKTPSHQWAKFQNTLKSLGAKRRVDLLLFTGKDAALAADGQSESLTAVRRGSVGDRVKKLQEHLGMPPTGRFDAETLDKFTGAQRGVNDAAGIGRFADGVYSLDFERRSGWRVLDVAGST